MKKAATNRKRSINRYRCFESAIPQSSDSFRASSTPFSRSAMGYAFSLMLQLRDYQTEALLRVKDAYKSGKRRVLVSLPTGTGKTVVFAHFPTAFMMKKRLLVLAHREELLLQAHDKFRSIDPDLKVEIEQAGARASADAKVVVASVPTLARAGSARLSRLC